jgi:hypothetical protein
MLVQKKENSDATKFWWEDEVKKGQGISKNRSSAGGTNNMEMLLKSLIPKESLIRNSSASGTNDMEMPLCH